MDILTMRQKLKAFYNQSPKWNRKVDQMPDPQVMAVYYQLEARIKEKEENAIYERREEARRNYYDRNYS